MKSKMFVVLFLVAVLLTFSPVVDAQQSTIVYIPLVGPRPPAQGPVVYEIYENLGEANSATPNYFCAYPAESAASSTNQVCAVDGRYAGGKTEGDQAFMPYVHLQPLNIGGSVITSTDMLMYRVEDLSPADEVVERGPADYEYVNRVVVGETQDGEVLEEGLLNDLVFLGGSMFQTGDVGVAQGNELLRTLRYLKAFQDLISSLPEGLPIISVPSSTNFFEYSGRYSKPASTCTSEERVSFFFTGGSSSGVGVAGVAMLLARVQFTNVAVHACMAGTLEFAAHAYLPVAWLMDRRYVEWHPYDDQIREMLRVSTISLYEIEPAWQGRLPELPGEEWVYAVGGLSLGAKAFYQMWGFLNTTSNTFAPFWGGFFVVPNEFLCGPPNGYENGTCWYESRPQ